jgi:hypothetical protein
MYSKPIVVQRVIIPNKIIANPNTKARVSLANTTGVGIKSVAYNTGKKKLR